MTVVRIDPLIDPRWDGFANAHPSATVYHLAAWARIFEESYRYTPRYLALEDPSGQLLAIMPLMQRRTLRGHALRSLPIYEIGGPIGQHRAGEAALMTAALSIGQSVHAKTHVGSFVGGLEVDAPGWIAIEGPPVWVLTLPSDADGLTSWAKGNQRRPLMKALRHSARVGLRVRESGSDADLRRFYDMLLANMRRKHFVNRTLRQLRLTKELLTHQGVFRLFVAEYEGKPIAGLISLAFGDTVEALHIAHEEGTLPLHPHHALYKYAMNWGLEHGFRRLSFGYAWPESSLGAFKARWGAEPIPLYSYAWRPGGIPDSVRTPDPVLRAGGAHAAAVGPRRALSWLWERTPLPVLRVATDVARRFL